MRSAYKSPVMWILIATLVVFAIVEHILSVTIDSNWKYLFYGTSTKALVLATFFTFCMFTNFVGTRFVVDSPLTKQFPSIMISIVGCLAGIALLLIMLLGIDNRAGIILLFATVITVVIAIPTAFFLRGMAVPTMHDH